MEVDKVGVHATHCCSRHGCKYCDDDCPVVMQKVEQEYTQECCDYFSEAEEISLVIFRMEELSRKEPRSLMALGLKTQEETGELAEEILIAHGESPTKSPGEDGVRGEAVDVCLMAMSVFMKHGGTLEEWINTCHKKMTKWEKDIKKRTQC